MTEPYTVYPADSPPGRAILARRGVTAEDLARAVAEHERREKVRAATPIGVHEKDGFFASTREGWRPDQPDAFAEPILNIPWVQILEYLGRVPAGTTGEFITAGFTRPSEESAAKTIRVSDATYRAIAGEAILPFCSTAARQPDGSWLVPVSDDVWEMLQQVRLAGETDDDAILRAIREYHGKKPN